MTIKTPHKETQTKDYKTNNFKGKSPVDDKMPPTRAEKKKIINQKIKKKRLDCSGLRTKNKLLESQVEHLQQKQRELEQRQTDSEKRWQQGILFCKNIKEKIQAEEAKDTKTLNKLIKSLICETCKELMGNPVALKCGATVCQKCLPAQEGSRRHNCIRVKRCYPTNCKCLSFPTETNRVLEEFSRCIKQREKDRQERMQKIQEDANTVIKYQTLSNRHNQTK